MLSVNYTAVKRFMVHAPGCEHLPFKLNLVKNKVSTPIILKMMAINLVRNCNSRKVSTRWFCQSDASPTSKSAHMLLYNNELRFGY